MRRLAVLAAAVAGVWGCGSSQHELPLPPAADAGPCAVACGEVCCGAGERCTAPGLCCRPSCEGRRCGDDGCGGSCGQCEEGYRCGAQDGQCHCEPESDLAFCTRLEVVCGSASGTDNCGAARTVTCDRCVAPETCDAASGTCRCVGEEAAELCADAGQECGLLSVQDRCGEARQVQCAECAPGEVCGAGNTCEVCVNESELEVCGRLQAQCGPASGEDNCRELRRVDCGGCQPGSQCDRASNRCEACTPESDEVFCARNGGLECGEAQGVDNCGWPRRADCGRCSGHDVCDEQTNRCHPCVPEPNDELCAAQGRQCGPLTAEDRCGATRQLAECGPCPNALDRCDDAGGCVLCLPETDAELCTFHYKNCGTPTLTDRCGQTRTPSCGSCAGIAACQANGVCGEGTAPTNDACAWPERLVFDASGTASATGDLTHAAGNYSGACGGNGGRDLVYAFTLTRTMNLQVAVAPTSGGSFWPVVYLRGAGCGSGPELACGFAPTDGQSTTVLARALPAGDYFVVVDGYTSASGPFALTATATVPSAAPPHDTCADSQRLVFTGNTATATGETIDATDDYAVQCDSSRFDGPDLVFLLPLAADASVRVQLTRGATSNYEPAVVLASACPGAGPAIACAAATNGVAILSRGVLVAGDYFLIVDGTAGSYGPFTLEVTTSTPVYNDVCSGATDVPLLPVAGSGDLVGTVLGDPTGAIDDYASSCRPGANGRDLVYKFTIPTGSVKKVRAELVPQAGAGVKPNLYVRTDCQPGGVEKGCVYSYPGSDPVALVFNRLAAGTYYVFVDGWVSATNTPVALTVTASEPPPAPVNDLCLRAMPLTLSKGWVQVADTTGAAGDDYAGSCATAASPHTGADMVYQVVTPSAGTLAAKVQPAAGSEGFKPAVYIQSACGSGTSDQACGNADYYGLATASASNLAAGTYFVVVDGLEGTSGEFKLDVMFWSGPASDDCASANVPLSFDAGGEAVVVGNSCALANDSRNTATADCTYTGGGNDAVYRLDLATPKDLRVTFDPGHTYYSEIYVQQTSCGAAAPQRACSESDRKTMNTLVLKRLPADTYYVWLDNAAAGYCGPFRASFHLSDPPAPPANDGCAAAQDVPIDATTGIGLATGTTDSAADDGGGSCSPAPGGPDAVFRFELASTRSVEIQVVPDAGSDLVPVVYLQSVCGSAATENGCQAGAAGLGARLQYPRLGAGTYYVVVDSADADSTGAFSLVVTTSPAGPPVANDVCANALAMPAFDPITGKSSLAGDTLEGNDDDSSYCAKSGASFGGADLVYSFELASDSVVTAQLTRATGAAAYKPALSLRRGCALSTEVACGSDSAASPTGRAAVTTALSAGTWYVVVDGLNGSFGAFTLELSLGAGPEAGDSCGTAVPLSFTGNTATVTADLTTAGLTDGYAAATCSTTAATSADRVYSFSLSADKVVTAAVAPDGTGRRPFVYLRSACNDPFSEVACGYTQVARASAVLTSPRLPPGTYFVFVDANAPRYGGPFTLTVTLEDAVGPVPGNDLCAAALPLPLSGGEAHLSGDTRDAHDDYGGTGSCGPTNATVGRLGGGDVVYVFPVGQGGSVTAAVTVDASTPGYQPAIYLRSSCASAAPADQLACDFPSATTFKGAAITANNLAAGTYYLIVDGRSGSSGRFDLDVYVRTTSLDNSTCAAAKPLAFANAMPGVDTARIVGDTLFGAASTEGVKQGSQYCFSSGKELRYAFTTGATKDVVVTVRPLSSTYSPAVYLRADCADADSQLLCRTANAGLPVTLTTLKLPAGTYYLVVDSQSATGAGPFEAVVELRDPPPPPANDTCRGATALVLPPSGGGALTVPGSTAPASDDYVGGCQTGGYPLDGADVVYKFVPAADTQVTAKVVARAGSELKAAIYLRSSCETVSDDTCKYNSSAGSSSGAQVVASVRAGTTYYLIVDGVGRTYGDFDLTLTVSDPAYLEGDSCTNPVALDALFAPNPTDPAERIATVRGNTSLASSDYLGGCQSSKTSVGPELVYRFTLAAESLVHLNAAPDGTGSSYVPEIYLQSSCGDPTTALVCASSPTPASVSVKAYRVPAGTYYLFADTYMFGAGPFVLTVSVQNMPASASPNDTCTGATPLSFLPGAGSAQVAAVHGEDSTLAGDDAQGACYGSRGGELVYRFSTTGPQSFKAVVTPDAGDASFSPVVYLRSVCDQSAESAELGCVGRPTGGAATLTLNSLPAGTYWLFVDAYLASQWVPAGGRYALEVTLDAVASPAPPANDGCPGARPIALSGPAPSVTTLGGQTTIGATNDSGGSCSAGSGTLGADVVYYLDLTAPAKLDAKVIFADSAARPAVYVRQSCRSVELGCGFSASTTNATATAPYLLPGRYYLWVDGNDATASDFQLELTLSAPTLAPPPANALCGPGLPALTKGVPVNGTSVGAQNANVPLNPVCASNSAAGPNVVYTYTPTQDGFFTVRLVPTSLSTGSSDLMLWMSERCLDGNACVAVDNGGYGLGTYDRIRYYGRANVTYYLVVDGSANNTGTFELLVE